MGGSSEDYDVVKSAGSSGGYANEATDGKYRRKLIEDWAEAGLPSEQATAMAIARVRYDIDWQAINYVDHTQPIDVPTLIFHGWNSSHSPGTAGTV